MEFVKHESDPTGFGAALWAKFSNEELNTNTVSCLKKWFNTICCWPDLPADGRHLKNKENDVIFYWKFRFHIDFQTAMADLDILKAREIVSSDERLAFFDGFEIT